MPGKHHVVVDGSNLATEGRTVPSLAQLDEAVRSYLVEDPEADVVVVVDASFAHRIEPAERAKLEAAELHGEVVAPPAGAIGRGDAFVLRIAERTGAVVLSNDSFQEFHDEHPWLFDDGRLVGGKPVAGVGWIFTPRRPVRGPRSRKATRSSDDDEQLSAPRKAAEVAKALKKATKAAPRTRAKAGDKDKETVKETKAKPVKGDIDKAPAKKKAAKVTKPTKAATKQDKPALKADGAKRAKAPAVTKAAKLPGARISKAAAESDKASKAAKAPAKPAKPAKVAKATKAAPARRGTGPLRLRAAIDQATEEVLDPGVSDADPSGKDKAASGKRRRRAEPPPAVNEPLAFITFVAAHPLGSSFEGVVVSFTSHGAMVDVPLPDGGVLHCYAPLAGLRSPPPRAAREVLTRGQRRDFALVALDPPRRMAELALPDMAAAQLGERASRPKAAG
jgi:hypothetical protein